VAALATVLAVLVGGGRAQSCALPGERRTDCGYVGIGQEECENSGCCWAPNYEPGEDYPWCFYKDMDLCQGYTVASRRDTELGFELELVLRAPYARPSAGAWHAVSSRWLLMSSDGIRHPPFCRSPTRPRQVQPVPARLQPADSDVRL